MKCTEELLTDNDLVLISNAKLLSCTQWGNIEPDKADTNTAKRILENIQTKLSHLEEALDRYL